MSETAGASSVYAVMATWLTPSCLFVFINLVVGTIAITSRFANATKKQHQLVRSPSLLDRLTSFNLRYHKHEPTSTSTSTPSSDVVDPIQNPESIQSPDSSRLDRVRSLSIGRTGIKEPEPAQQQLTRAPSILQSLTFDRSDSVKETEPESEAEVTGGGELVEEEGVDAKADDFINRFRQHLRLQRLDSVLRYRDMLK